MKIDDHDAPQTSSIKMKVSARRKAHAIELRDLALKIIERDGNEHVVCRIPVESTSLGDLEMTYTPEAFGESLLDVWRDKKVLSVRWNKTGRIEIVNYEPGSWEAALAAKGVSRQ